ncbi:MAG: glyoxylate/hydroxypyruvate reductase A [Burkholderiaceae bacterium]
MSILVAADFAAEEWAAWWPALHAALPDESLVREADDPAAVDIALVANPPERMLAALPRLRFIQSLWAGVDRLLADSSVPTHIPLARMVDPAMSRAIAETALWAVLSLHRDYFDYAAQQGRRVWLQRPQRRADEVAVAVLGLGAMGRAVALHLLANGYRVFGWSRTPVALEGVTTSAGAASLASLLGQAEIVINLLPLTTATRGLFDHKTLASMRRGASLVNLARGDHVVEPDLLAALATGRLRRAILDVFAHEPLAPDHAFWSHARVTVLPHIAALTDPRSAAQVVARNVRALRSGAPLAHLVDRSRGY